MVFAFTFVALHENVLLTTEPVHRQIPSFRSKKPNNLQGRLGNCVVGVRTVRRKGRIEGVVVSYPALNELVEHLAAECFSCIRRILGAKVVPEIVHNAFGDGASPTHCR